MKHEPCADLHVGDAQLDRVVVRLDQEALVVDLSALLGVEAGDVEQDADLLVLGALHELLILADGKDLALARLEPGKKENEII